MQCPGALFGSRKIATGSPEGHLTRNFKISLLGHLPEPKTGLKKNKKPGKSGVGGMSEATKSAAL